MLGVLAAIITILSVAYDLRRPRLVIEIVSTIDAVDVRDSVEGLSVTIGDLDILRSGRTVRIVNLRIRNAGRASVLKDYYDPVYPVGFRLNQGSFLGDPAVLSGSNPYLLQAADLRQIDSKKAELQPVIFDPGDWITYRVTVITSENTDIAFQATGKVAGQQTIPIVDTSRAASETGVIERAFSGPIVVQILRAFGYTIGLIAASVLLGSAIDNVGHWIGTRARRGLVDRFGQQKPDVAAEIHSILVEYREHGADSIRQYLEATADEADLNERAIAYAENGLQGLLSQHKRVSIYDSGVMAVDGHRVPTPEFVAELQAKGLIETQKDYHRVRKQKRDKLTQFVQFVKEQKPKEYRRIVQDKGNEPELS